MTIHMPKGYQDPSGKNSSEEGPSKMEIAGMWATLGCTALCVILMIYKMFQY